MKLPRAGSGPAWLAGLFTGRPLVSSLVTSFQVDATRIGKELGWQRGHPSFGESGPAAIRALADGS